VGQPMSTKWIAVNLIALSIAILLGWRLRTSVDGFNAENDLARIQPVKDIKEAMAPDAGLPLFVPPQGYDAARFADIMGKNIFSESRTNEENVATAVVETPPLAQKPILVGVTISGDQRLASIIDPTNPQLRRSQTKRIGDTYQGYTITEITMDQIVLESENRREIIPLHDGTKRQQKGGKTAILSTRVVSFGEGGSSGGAPLATVTSARPANQTPTQPTSVPVGRTAAPAAAAGQTSAVPTPAQTRPAAAQAVQPQPQSPYTSTDSQGRTIIRTPFGDIVRPAQPSQ
jgi:hypothetical protein